MDPQVTASPTPAARSPRDSGVEAARFAWALAVVALHSIPIALPGRDTGPAPLWALIVATIARAAVPFFFVASGFYLSADPRKLVRALLRLGAIYLACLAGYGIAMWLVPVRQLDWAPVPVLTGGIVTPLWFIPALAGSLAFVGWGRRLVGLPVTGALALLLALAGPILYAYGPVIGLRSYPWRLEPLVRHMAGPVLVWTGLVLQGRSLPRAGIAWTLLALAIAALFAEQALVSQMRGASHVIEFDMLFATFVAGVLAFIAARAVTAPRWLAHLGGLSLGIYLVHIGFVWVARSRLPQPDAIDSFQVFAFATVAAVTLTAGYQVLRRRAA